MAARSWIIGAALSVIDLPKFRPWLLEKPRDLELQDFCFSSVLNGDWSPIVDAAKVALDGFEGRVGIHGPFSGFDIDTRDEDVRAIVRKRMDQALDVCAALGAAQMVVHSPYRSWDFRNLDLRPRGRAQKIDAVHACLSGAVGRAEAQGVTLVIENIQDIDPMDRLHLARSFDSDAVRVSIDTGHAHCVHVTDGAPAVDRFIRLAGDWLGHVHLQDADGFADRHWAVGEGTICWPEVMRAIGDCGAEPHLVLELNDNAGVRASADHLEG
ncbi:MAG: sugar phosphate isomerase/epimerase family protein, partial [Paracoccaceae bacterium]